MKKKKLFILSGPLDNQRAGVHRATFEMIKAFHASCPEDLEICLIRERASSEFPNFKTIVVPCLKWLPGYPSLRLFFIVPLVCILNKADYVFETAHFGPFNLPSRIKRITFIHDLTPILFPRFHTFNGAYLQKLFLPRILRKTDLIIANSENTKNDIENKYPFTLGKIKRIYLGVSSFFKRVIDQSVLDKYNIDSPFFLSVGTIEPRKSIDTLLKAFKICNDRSDQALNLVLVGSKGWKSDQIYRDIESHPYSSQIKVTGFVSDEELNVMYSMCQSLVYPSVYEGFGLPLLEAHACGTCCIVANNSSLKELAGSNTSLFKTRDENDLAEKMLESLNKEKGQCSSEVDKAFSWNNFAQQFFESLKVML